MPANVEIKARVPDMDALRRLAEEVADGPPTLLSQSDTFFRAEKGRLKLRVVNDRAELIFYDRPDGIEGPKLATFQHAAVSDADALRECLGAGCCEAWRGLLSTVREGCLLCSAL